MSLILRKIELNNFIKILKRHKHHSNHWSVLRKKNKPKDKALEYFDDFYGSVYGSAWQYIRASMLKEKNKHIAIVNNFANSDEICQNLSLLGAMNMKELYEIHRDNYIERSKNRITKRTSDKTYNMSQPMTDILEDKCKSEMQSIYPDNYEVPEQSIKDEKNKNNDDDDNEEILKSKSPMDPVELRPLEDDLSGVQVDENRIVKPSVGLTSNNLYEYIPATKLKGLDDYVLESEHYGYYTKSADFEVKIVDEVILNIPEHLKIYTFEAGNDTRFPTPRRTFCDTYDYYLMDGASILPVLALDLQLDDTILDMCAAPGGKSLAILQSLLPKHVVANDVSLSRCNHMQRVFTEYFGDINTWNNKLYISQLDCRAIEEQNVYNKILVDVPCTTDRHNLHNNENNIFSPARVRERLKLPELQAEILLQALKIVAPGGTVVYSTCSLSPIQNDGVVQMALKKCWEETESNMIVKNIGEALAPLRFIYKFATDCGLKYGQVVIPTKNNNWGPMYFCKIVKLP